MKLQIGRQVPGEGGVESALADCHTRIRHFTDLAQRLAAAAQDGSAGTEDETDVVQVARGIARYFSEALPLHEEDEEDSIKPRLVGRDAAVDAALQAMHDQHDSLHGPTRRLVALASAVAEDPGLLADPETAAGLGEESRALAAGFAEHLDLEERVILPAIGSLLDDGERAEIREEIRARRDD